MDKGELRSCLLYEGKDSKGRYYFRVKKAIYNFRIGDPNTLSQNLGRKVNTRYVITFLLAEEY